MTLATDGDRRAGKSRRRLVGRRITDLAKHPEQWVTPDAIAEYYGVPIKTVRLKWIGTGLLLAHTFPGRHTRVQVKHLIAFEQRHQIVPDSS